MVDFLDCLVGLVVGGGIGGRFLRSFAEICFLFGLREAFSTTVF